MDMPQCEISSSEESRLVTDCVFYLIVADQRKHGIKKTDLIRNVFKEHRKHYKRVIQQAELYLKEVAGLKLVELEATKGTFILENNMKYSKAFAEMSKYDKMKIGLIFIILSIIFMKEDFIPETDLWKALKKIGIDTESKHPLFGDIKKFVTHDLVKQLYVQYEKQENSDPPVFVLSWGHRAKVEVSKIEVLKFVCDVFRCWKFKHEVEASNRCKTMENCTVFKNTV